MEKDNSILATVILKITTVFPNYLVGVGGAKRQYAGRDLGVVVMRAWDIGVKMQTSGLSFQVIFPETAGGFSASSMIAKDQPPSGSTANPQLHLLPTTIEAEFRGNPNPSIDERSTSS